MTTFTKFTLITGLDVEDLGGESTNRDAVATGPRHKKANHTHL